jgi:hypothetical protein
VLLTILLKGRPAFHDLSSLSLNVTEFMPDHPGGEKAILLYAGRCVFCSEVN